MDENNLNVPVEEPEDMMTDNEHSTEENVISFKRSHLYAVLLPLAFVVGLSVGFLFWGRDSESPPSVAEQPAVTVVAQAADSEQDAAPTQQPVKRYDVPEDDDPVFGPDDAPITIVEFSDYECPFCQRWHQEVFLKIIEEYPDQVRIVYRDFPLDSLHPNATPAAESASCAAEQDAFWPYHDRLFSGGPLNKQSYLQYAEELDLDVDEFESCLDSGRYREEAQSDYQFASSMGVRSTPTFFLNGLPIVGAQPFDVFKEIIEKELAGEIPGN